jgi:hypothetical protein
MKTIKRLLGTILILLTVVFQSKSQDVVVESNDKIIYRKNSSSPAFMTLDTDNGRVGIGTSNPQQALEVNGQLSAGTYLIELAAPGLNKTQRVIIK